MFLVKDNFKTIRLHTYQKSRSSKLFFMSRMIYISFPMILRLTFDPSIHIYYVLLKT